MPFKSGNWKLVDLSTFDSTPWLISQEFFWPYIILMRIQDLAMSQSDAHFWRFYSWGHRSHYGLDHVSSVSCKRSFCYNHDPTGNIAIVRKLRAVPYCVPMFWAITCSHMLKACSRDLGVSCNLKSCWGNTHVTYTKNFIGKLILPDVPLDSIVSPGWTYCPCKGFFILPSKTLFLS